MRRFTYGKWTVRKLLQVEWGVFAERDGFRDREPVADCFDNEANARLIAAAPEMYELLNVWVNVQAQPTLRNAQKRAEELLARIDGDSNVATKEPEP